MDCPFSSFSAVRFADILAVTLIFKLITAYTHLQIDKNSFQLF